MTYAVHASRFEYLCDYPGCTTRWVGEWWKTEKREILGADRPPGWRFLAARPCEGTQGSWTGCFCQHHSADEILIALQVR